MNGNESKNKDLFEENSDEDNDDDLLSNLEKEHKSKMKQLGGVELNQNIFCDLYAKKKEHNHEKTKTTVFGFLHRICGAVPSNTRAVKYVKAVQNFTDEDIKNILVFVANLENDDVGTFFYGASSDQIDSALPSMLCDKNNGLSSDEILSIKKTYVILVLISFGVSPTKIKECLENENNKDLFKNLNWKSICKEAINLRKNIENSGCYRSDLYFCGNQIGISLLFLNHIVFVEKLLNNDKNFNSQDLSLSLENLYYQYYKHMNDGSDETNFKNFAASLSLLFILQYLELKNKNEEIEKLFGENGVFTNLFRDSNWNENAKKHKKDLKALSEKYGNDFVLYLKSNWFVCDTFKNFYDAMFKDFYKIIDNLPQECIFIFMCEMMRGVTLTNSQLAYVKQKIQNRDLSSYLEKINYDPKYKLTDISIIENGTKIYWVNYLCEKLFRGIGYLLGIAFILAIHAAIATILILIIDHWFLYVLCALLVLSALYFTISGIRKTLEFDFEDTIFRRCVDFVQRAYDKTVGYWIKTWALHYSTNKIPEPPIINNYPPNQKSIKESILQSEGQFNLSMEKDKIKDKNEEGK